MPGACAVRGAPLRCLRCAAGTGNPGGRGVLRSHHGIVTRDAAGHSLDSIAMTYRYIAGYDPNATRPANLTVALVNASGGHVHSLYSSPPLGDYPYRPFARYSPPVAVKASGLAPWVRAAPKVYLEIVVDNNDRNLQLPLDDRAGGFDVGLGWAKGVR